MLAKGSEYWILGGAVLTAFMGFFTPYALLGIVLTLSLFLFFRDPERLSESHDATDVVSPADGRVLKIQDNHLSIFMNIHNVHVNRSPVDGEVIDIRYTKEASSPLFIRNRTKMSGTALLSELGLGMLSSPKSQVQSSDGSYATSSKMKFSGEARE